MERYKLILASASPRRSKILKSAGYEFDVIPSAYEEKLSNLQFFYEKIENLAYNKAKNVLVNHPNLKSSIIIGADTVVVLDNQILGKPKDKADAFNMLKSLSGRKHFVVTSICMINSETNESHTKSTTSYVTFDSLSDTQISSYIEKFNPLDKAGAYGIQELPSGFVKEVEGSFENIVGLCPKAIKSLLELAVS